MTNKTTLLLLSLFIFLTISTVGNANAATFTVTKIADTNDGTCDSDCSLREAIATANSTTADDTIVFDATIFASAQTITLGGTPLTINSTTTAGKLAITGTGANLLTVSGNNLNRVFVNNGGDLTFSGLTVSRGNANGGDGGGISNSGIMTITDSTIRDSVGNFGGGINNIDNTGNVITMTNVTVTGNSAFGGGGIRNGGNGGGGTVTLLNSNVFGNSSGNQGGGIFNTLGIINLTNTNVTANNAVASGGIGNLSGTVTVTNSNVSRNVAGASNGGGILHNGGILIVTNSTVSNNRCGRQGGGIFSATTGSTTLINATISENTSGTGGGGIVVLQGTPSVRNTIFTDNINNGSPSDISGPINSQGYNLVSNTGGSSITGTLTGNILGQSALLTPLGNYGGLTQTRKLRDGSPAIDAGSNALAIDTNNQALTTDQRGAGFPRIIGTTVDMGATEKFPSLNLTVDTTSDNGSLTACTATANDCSLRGAISRANDSAGDDTIVFDATVFAAAQTITLGGSELSINENGGLTITGTGANLLTINGNNQSRVFLVNPNAYVAISGMTVTGGNGVGGFSGFGGGIANALGDLTLTAVTVSSNTATIDGGGVAGDGVTTLVNSTVSNNSANSSGGGIASNSGGTLSLTNTTISGNTAGFINGGIANLGPATITGSTISNNTCLGTGGSTGGIGTAGDLIITNSTISGNTMPSGSSNSGGGIWANANLTITNSTITDNQGFDIGGIRNAGSATFILRNTIVAGNRNSATVPEVIGAFTANNNLIGNVGSATGFSGNGNLVNANPLLSVLGNNGGTTQTHALLPGSPAINAGTATNAPTLDQRGKARIGATDIGAFEAPANLVVINTGNAAGSLREAITTANATTADESISFAIPPNDAGCTNGVCTINLSGSELPIINNATTAGTLVIHNSTGLTNLIVSGNNQSRVLVVHIGANLILSGLTISRGNTGCVYNLQGIVTITDSAITNCTAISMGGGIYSSNGATLRVANSTISGNSAGFGGGGIANDGTLTVMNSTISGNSAPNCGGGGGIRNSGTGNITVTNSTISGNTSSGGCGGSGGGISNFNTMTLTNSTVSGNSASRDGGGILNFIGATVNSRNSIIAGNSAGSLGPDFDGTLTSQGYNLIGNTVGTTINGDITGNILNQNARLAPLGFYGGTMETNALLANSPAINNGNSATSPTNDQRGAARIGTADIGAFELNNANNGGTFAATLPTGKTNFSYNYTLIPNSGSFTYSITSGSLPNGLSLTSNFVGNNSDEKTTTDAPTAVVAISGVPTQGGTFNFAITATDGVNSNVTNYKLNVLVPTAASSTVSGRVFTPTGRGLLNAFVVMTNQNGDAVSVRTNQFGYYRFNGVQSGEIYIFSVQSKRYRFASQVVSVAEDLDGLNFFAQ
jgi:CSLREA domain-containing protein